MQNRADINAIGRDGCTPLHLAVMNGNKEIVELLLSKKANVYLKCFYNSAEGYTALENAVANRNKKNCSIVSASWNHFRVEKMSYEQIVIYGIILISAIKIFLFFRRIYKNLVNLRESEKENGKYVSKKTSFYDIQVYKENLKIVGIAKPVGKWTQMAILNNQLMQRLAQLIQQEGDQKGFWELFVKAQVSTRGRYKGRGR